jgi:hypothetical protein
MFSPRKKYDEEFNKLAVRMSHSSECPVTAVAESLGTTSDMIYRWRKKYTPPTMTKCSLPNSGTSSANFESVSPSWKRRTTY